MTILSIRHRTLYRYRRPVSLLPHRLMLRPRESRDLRLTQFELRIIPEAVVSWAYDVAGNAIATASFSTPSDTLCIDSHVEIQLDAAAWPVFDIAASAIAYPFAYSEDEKADLGALAVQHYDDEAGRLRDWANGFVRSEPTDTLSLLKEINAGIWSSLLYEVRVTEGTQHPTETLDLGRGTCRDYAVLLVEAARCLGFGARIVSGYITSLSAGLGDLRQTTHAWAEIFVPGAGWIPFDPTNNAVGGSNLIPVAVGRDITRVTPIAGSYIGGDQELLDMSADVFVRPASEAASRSHEAYRSANGDVWWVLQDAHGKLSVRHTPNRASGGQARDLPIDDFLAIGGSGPEHISIREIAQKLRHQ